MLEEGESRSSWFFRQPDFFEHDRSLLKNSSRVLPSGETHNATSIGRDLKTFLKRHYISDEVITKLQEPPFRLTTVAHFGKLELRWHVLAILPMPLF